MALSHLLRSRVKPSSSSFYLLSQLPYPPCFSSLSMPDSVPQSPPPPPPKPSSLSARMSFIFDQIDEIDRNREEKDETLQRIRAWRESKKQQDGSGMTSVPEAGEGNVMAELKSELEKSGERMASDGGSKKEVELVHPWPEWIELMERLVQQNYFDEKRKDEEGMIKDIGFDFSDAAEDEQRDFTRDFRTVQTAVVNFGRDRFDILRSLSRQDIQILVGYGCPSADKRVVFSAKLLRKHVHLDEGDVCSACTLRNSCERAYLLTNKEDEARTIDVMRILLAYSFDPTDESAVNKSILKLKSVKNVIRKLLRDVVRLSAVPIDPNLPPPVIRRPPPKVKQPPPPPKKRIGRYDVEMKKGDWLCPKCDFLNFAKNTVCLQCDAKRPKRQLLPGEWECPQCNFLNYRRNTVCFHCEHKRPPDTYSENQFPEKQRGPRISVDKVDRKDITNAWNFDFDDDESDGADVAAFEYADAKKLDEDFPLGKHNLSEDGTENSRRPNKGFERGYPNSRHGRSGVGFDDFDDDDDDVDSYELVNQNEAHQVSRVGFSEVEGDSESEDIDSTRGNWHARGRTQFTRAGKKQMRRRDFRDSDDAEVDFDTDDDLPVHPDWKSSHVADSKRQNRGQRAMNFGSDDDLVFDSESDDETIGSRKKVDRKGSNSKNSMRGGRSGFKSESFSETDADDDIDYRSPKQRKESGRNGLGKAPRGPSGMISGKKTSPNRGSNRSGAQGRSNTSPNRGSNRSGAQGRSNNFKNQSASYLDDERYQRPRMNVR